MRSGERQQEFEVRAALPGFQPRERADRDARCGREISQRGVPLPAQRPQPWPHRGETVLVVDDEPAVLEATSRILRQNGYATLEAATYEEALALAASRDFQLLLTDSVMPRMSGATLAERVAGRKPGLAILYMSGQAQGMPVQQRDPGEETARIQKPFDQQTLLETVHAALSASFSRSCHFLRRRGADGCRGCAADTISQVRGCRRG